MPHVKKISNVDLTSTTVIRATLASIYYQSIPAFGEALAYIQWETGTPRRSPPVNKSHGGCWRLGRRHLRPLHLTNPKLNCPTSTLVYPHLLYINPEQTA